jgi:hypothetical protein
MPRQDRRLVGLQEACPALSLRVSVRKVNNLLRRTVFWGGTRRHSVLGGTIYDPPYTEMGKALVIDRPVLAVTVTAIIQGPPTSKSKPGTT